MASLSGTLATMGPGIPYAIAAKFAHPDRSGDRARRRRRVPDERHERADHDRGKYYERWADQRLIVLVLHNNDLNQVTWEQRAMEGDPKFVGSQQLPDFPYARYAELVGLEGIRVDAPDEIGAAWDAAFAADRPVVLEAITDPEVPPLPPHITLEQAQNFMKAVIGGDPDAKRMIGQSFVQKLAELLPGRRDGGRSRDRASTSRRTRSRPTSRSPTARSTGTRPRSSSSRRTQDDETGSWLHVHRPRCGRADPRAGLGRDPRDRPARRAGRLGGDEPCPSEHRPLGARLDGALGGRHRALGPESASVRAAARCRARRRARRGSDLRKRRLHLVLARAADEPARRLGRRRHPAREDEARPRTRRRPGNGSTPSATRSGRTPSCSSTPTAPSVAKRRSRGPSRYATEWAVTWFEEPVSSEDVDGPSACFATPCPAGLEIAAGEYGDTLPVVQAARARRRLSAGGRDALRRLHGAAARWPVSPTPSSSISPATARRSSRRTASPPSAAFATWSISTITCVSSRCSSTACSSPRTVRSGPTGRAPGTASS